MAPVAARWGVVTAGTVDRCGGGHGGEILPAPTLGQEAFQRASSGDVTEPRQRLLLQLPDPFARDAELRADLLERHGLLPFQPKIEAQDASLTFLQRGEHRLDRFRERVL